MNPTLGGSQWSVLGALRVWMMNNETRWTKPTSTLSVLGMLCVQATNDKTPCSLVAL